MPLTTWVQARDAQSKFVRVSKNGITTGAAGRFTNLKAASGEPGSVALAAASSSNPDGSSSQTGSLVSSSNSGYLKISRNINNELYLKSAEISGAVSALHTHYLIDKLAEHNITPLTTLGTATTNINTLRTEFNFDADFYRNVILAVEITTAISAGTAVTAQVTYTNQSGVTGRTSGNSGSLAGLNPGVIIPLSLQAGDLGAKSFEAITIGGTAATSGAINIGLFKIISLFPGKFDLGAAAGTPFKWNYDCVGAQIDPEAALMVGMITGTSVTGVTDAMFEFISVA